MTSGTTPQRRLEQMLASLDEHCLTVQAAARRLSPSPGMETVPPAQAAEELRRLLEERPHSDVQLAQARDEWERCGRPGADELQPLVERHAARLQQLLTIVQTSLRRLESARDGMRPELDATVRRQSMQRAYGRSSG